ncbi:MAG: hypothetical protein K5770_19965 [Lachnospiraceae bacterium]|nr:hypothetical protein [Lachnospiraceae bacterium]
MSQEGSSLIISAKKIRLSKISIYHYIRFAIRSIAFVILLYYYILYKVRDGIDIYSLLTTYPIAFIIIFIMFIAEMILRLFPSSIESPGCQKQFKKNYIKTGKTNIVIQDNNAVMLVLLVWIGINFLIGAFYLGGLLDDGIMILLSVFYSVCDMICILFFCPFQTWFLKNKCCCTCRIYNWDYAMMFTPLFFIHKWYCWVLLTFAFILMVKWEIIFYKYPERFSENTNGYLGCANCPEKLCIHKTQLNTLRKKIAIYAQERIKRLKI